MDGPFVREVTVPNAQGIHARPSQAIVTTAESFEARVRLSVGGRTAEARSILSVMTLGAAQGATVVVQAEGPEAAEAVQALVALIERGFEEA